MKSLPEKPEFRPRPLDERSRTCRLLRAPRHSGSVPAYIISTQDRQLELTISLTIQVSIANAKQAKLRHVADVRGKSA